MDNLLPGALLLLLEAETPNKSHGLISDSLSLRRLADTRFFISIRFSLSQIGPPSIDNSDGSGGTERHQYPPEARKPGSSRFEWEEVQKNDGGNLELIANLGGTRI
jgi:hypothetical protein